MDGHFELKHPASIQDSQQMTFTDSSLAMQPKAKQKTCYVRKGTKRFSKVPYGIYAKRIKSSIPSIPTDRIAVFPGAI
ncbi:hypothetical protein Ngar_c03490 [Candidatus Nitrososphaera gargensis Ga9.2]|uniref:Uncharacterized protein n=2 Tax=Candidatus Nitrososphaera gargensis TaxID=497727 RepID=K0IHL4_NITGG|nr:hypothetical protein Ngar_c03190 [Candidatus Nitrososphaera gargensis Ga9.2]AFU57297.1 hypothetical protein Ngar_c03490 [Candidatus Nitrososphaera gargensis Ga9.2]